MRLSLSRPSYLQVRLCKCWQIVIDVPGSCCEGWRLKRYSNAKAHRYALKRSSVRSVWPYSRENIQRPLQYTLRVSCYNIGLMIFIPPLVVSVNLSYFKSVLSYFCFLSCVIATGETRQEWMKNFWGGGVIFIPVLNTTVCCMFYICVHFVNKNMQRRRPYDHRGTYQRVYVTPMLLLNVLLVHMWTSIEPRQCSTEIPC